MVTPNEEGLSPLEALSYKRFGGHTTYSERTVTLSTNVSRVLANNPNRVFWSIINEDTNDFRWNNDPVISAADGWLVPASGGVVICSWEDEGEVVGYEVYARATAGTCYIRIREVFRL